MSESLFERVQTEEKAAPETAETAEPVQIDEKKLRADAFELSEELQKMLNEVRLGLSPVMSQSRQISPAIDRQMYRLREHPSVGAVRDLLAILEQDICSRAKQEAEQMIVRHPVVMEMVRAASR